MENRIFIGLETFYVKGSSPVASLLMARVHNVPLDVLTLVASPGDEGAEMLGGLFDVTLTKGKKCRLEAEIRRVGDWEHPRLLLAVEIPVAVFEDSPLPTWQLIVDSVAVLRAWGLVHGWMLSGTIAPTRRERESEFFEEVSGRVSPAVAELIAGLVSGAPDEGENLFWGFVERYRGLPAKERLTAMTQALRVLSVDERADLRVAWERITARVGEKVREEDLVAVFGEDHEAVRDEAAQGIIIAGRRVAERATISRTAVRKAASPSVQGSTFADAMDAVEFPPGR